MTNKRGKKYIANFLHCEALVQSIAVLCMVGGMLLLSCNRAYFENPYGKITPEHTTKIRQAKSVRIAVEQFYQNSLSTPPDHLNLKRQIEYYFGKKFKSYGLKISENPNIPADIEYKVKFYTRLTGAKYNDLDYHEVGFSMSLNFELLMSGERVFIDVFEGNNLPSSIAAQFSFPTVTEETIILEQYFSAVAVYQKFERWIDKFFVLIYSDEPEQTITTNYSKTDTVQTNPDSLSKGREILDHSISMLGGKSFKSIHSLIVNSRVIRYTPPSFSPIPMITMEAWPNLMKIEISYPYGKHTTFINGGKAFRRTPRGNEWLGSREVEEIRLERWYSIPYFFANIDNENVLAKYQGVAQVEGHDCEVIQIILDKHRQIKLFIGSDSKFPIKMEDASIEVYFYDFREVAGRMLPFKYVRYWHGEKQYELTVSDVTINTIIDEKELQPYAKE
jgi:hypothetical protein